MPVAREPNTEYVLSLSYGKDSLACLEAIKQLGYPLDRIVHAEVWATDTIPADLPPMVEFKKYADQIILERYGIKVEHICATRPINQREREQLSNDNSTLNVTRIKPARKEYTDSRTPLALGVTTGSKLECCNQLKEKVTYEKMFYHIPKRRISSNRGGQIVGFPVQGLSWCNGYLKTNSLRASNLDKSGELVYISQDKGFSESPDVRGAKKNIVQYLGIAADEPKRIERHNKPDIILPLVDIGWDEKYCREWCEKNNLLSPIYTSSARGGCWFCHNQGVDQLRLLRKDYPELWNILLKWDTDSPTSFKSNGRTVHDFDKRFQMEDEGIIKAGDKKFRWKQILS